MKKAALSCMLFAAILLLAGCGGENGNYTENGNSETEVLAEPVESTETEEKAFDADSLEASLTGIDLTIEKNAHNIYRGTFGDEEVLISIWIEEESGKTYLDFSGSYHADKLSFECELYEDAIRYQDNNFYLLLREPADGKLSGYYYESGSEVVECNLDLAYINYTQDREHLYTIGSNDDVENFAQEIIDMVNSDDMETFSSYIQFPVRLNIDGADTVVNSREDFLALDETKVFTNEFQDAMMNAYPEFMFSNGDDGVMAGDSECNVWINKNNNGELKIIAINN